MKNGENWASNPRPHKMTFRHWLSLAIAAILLIPLWIASQSFYAEQPKTLSPAPITSGQGIQAVVRATSFNATTGSLVLGIKPIAVGNLIDSRGVLTQDVEFRVVDDLGVNLIHLAKGEPLSTQEISIQTDGDVNQYPFDKYNADFSLLAEIKNADGSYLPLNLSVGTNHAETGWFTNYKISPEASSETKISIVSMHREPFHIALAIIFSLLMLLLAIIALSVGYLCVTHRRLSEPPVINWLGGLLFAITLVRKTLPGDPPIGCSLDVKIYVWAIIFCAVAIVLALTGWLQQSAAKQR